MSQVLRGGSEGGAEVQTGSIYMQTACPCKEEGDLQLMQGGGQ